MITLADQIACVERELKFRRRLYPHWVATRKMEQAEADTELARMEAVLVTLKGLEPYLFKQGGGEVAVAPV